jgi:hypothetical protein
MNASHNSSDSSPLLPLPSPELDRLNVFVGKWHVEGVSFREEQTEKNILSGAAAWVSDDSYEWMSGNYFLVHRWTTTNGNRAVRGMEVLGYDVNRQEFFSRVFDKSGNATRYKVVVEGETWLFAEPSTRYKVVFTNEGRQMNINWEWRQEGGDWFPWSNRIAIKK